MPGLSQEEKMKLDLQAGKVFRPASPIDRASIFSGRMDIFRKVVDTINNSGQHAILYGERGVGKTSLSNVIAELLQQSGEESQPILAPKINCDGTDSFSSVWKKVFREVEIQIDFPQLGFTSESKQGVYSFADEFEDKEVTPDDVKNTLTKMGKSALLIIILDEFDRLPNGETGRLFADTIKTLSDYSVPATLVIVGVADDVNDLISGHQSAERAIVQISVPRMSLLELKEIVTKGLKQLEMAIDERALNRMVRLSQGLPHYTHLLALHSARKALDDGDRGITKSHLDSAMNMALENTQQTIKEAYQKATTSPRKDHRFKEVLLACALAKTDDSGYFYAADVRSPMSTIMGRAYDIAAFARHLNDFSEIGRGPVLKKIGTKRRFRYRFINPLMQPYVIMMGIETKLINEETLEII